MSATLAAWIAFALLAVVDWYAVWRVRPRLEAVCKPATLAALVLVAVSLGALGTGTGRWLVAALALGLVGDVMLLGSSDRRFRMGLAAFLVGHLAYLGAFLGHGLDPQAWSWVALPLLLVSLLLTRDVVPTTHRRSGLSLSLPVAVYTGVIGAVLVLGFVTGSPWVAVGSAVFVASDGTLAVNRFVRPLPFGNLVVMTTYHVAQALIVVGLLT